MDFPEWEPVYGAILADFGFERAADERARDRLADLLPPSIASFDFDRLDLGGSTVAVAGAGPSLADELDRIGTTDRVLAASTAVDTLLDAGIGIDAMVTDLDKNPDTARALAGRGVPVAVHAHGDNPELLAEVVPTLDAANVLATTQAKPRGAVENVGGFTDGDRAAFLADHCGAGGLRFAGWEFDDPSVGRTKRRKLVWAERLLYWLERRRGERFALLDGRREGIDAGALPVG